VDLATAGAEPASTDGSAQMIVIHALQLMPGQPYRDNEKEVCIYALNTNSILCVILFAFVCSNTYL
jgi:hypothetical protein